MTRKKREGMSYAEAGRLGGKAKAKPKDERLTERVMVRFRKEDLQEIEEKASAHGLTLAGFIREAALQVEDLDLKDE